MLAVLRFMWAAFVFLAVFPTVCFAQTDAVPKPEVKPGDSWTYRWMDYWTNTHLRASGHLCAKGRHSHNSKATKPG